MHLIKKFIVLGSGNSGSGAIHDYLFSREDTYSPFNGYEFRLVNDPDGLNDLYNSLYSNFNINKTAISISRFEKYILRLISSNYNKKNNIYNEQLYDLTFNFINKITNIKYNGIPQFYLDKLTIFQKLIFYLNRFFLKKKANEINLLDMRLQVKKEVFLNEAIKYLENIFISSKNYDEKKNIVINQGGSFWHPSSSTIFYGGNTYQIIVTRDPKAIFWSMKRRNSLSYPGRNIKIFTKWYKQIMEQINQKEHENIIRIKFEEFFQNFEIEKVKLCKKLSINPKEKDNFDLDYTKKNLYKFEDNLSKDEIKYINDELKIYLQC